MLKNRLGWSYEPKTPFFISLVAIGVIVAIAAGCFLTYRYSISDKRDRETITFGVSVLGASIAIYGLLSAADSVRRSNAEKFASVSIAFVQRWNSPSYLPLKTAWRKLNKEMDDIKDDALRDALLRDDVEKRSNAVEVLNFFEEMATGINSGSVDDKLLRRYFEIVVVRAFERYEPWIRQHRIRKAAPGFYDELEELAHEWKKPESKR